MRAPMARDEYMDIHLEVDLDGDRDNFEDYNWNEEDTEEIADLTMEVEMNPVFLLIHHVEVIHLMHSSHFFPSSSSIFCYNGARVCKELLSVLITLTIQVLNLTGSLIKEVNPVDKLEYINFIENLTVLELGENQVRMDFG